MMETHITVTTSYFKILPTLYVCVDSFHSLCEVHWSYLICVACREKSDYILRVGQTSVANLTVDINNAGEDAHESSLIVTLPDSIDYLGTDSLTV